ncbi:hypothetical protein R1flu_018657 [Riccia fluitans]|uniref:Pentatricopeptide repeat-containing protein n=1 Tax=Riccia fluitans TaxID=41844 RepID=A0ABD1ZJZ4_9MARC
MSKLELCSRLWSRGSVWGVCRSVGNRHQHGLRRPEDVGAEGTFCIRMNHDSAATGSNPEVKKIYSELLETMKGHRIPSSTLVFSLLESCTTPDDVRLALDAVARLRTTKAVLGHQQANFGPRLSQSVLDACLRANDTNNAMKTIWEHNIYGFTACSESANQILTYARAQQDIVLMQKTLRTMSLNSLAPTRATAEIALRLCKDQGNEKLLFALAKEFHEGGVKFSSALYDVCLSTAANAGETKHALEVQQWRLKHNLPYTTASTFGLAKVLLLRRKPKRAAELIHTYVQDSEEKDMYMKVLVRAWPAEVLSRKKKSVIEANLREDIGILLDELKALGSNVKVDTAEFGTGKESLRKPVYE